jgi:hypothetical protein
LWISGSLAVAFGTLYALWRLKVPPFREAPPPWIIVDGSACVLAAALFAGRTIKVGIALWERLRDRRASGVKRSLTELNDDQRSLVATVVATGHSRFTRPYPEPRWLEELGPVFI